VEEWFKNNGFIGWRNMTKIEPNDNEVATLKAK
jgi:hypothetical protein